MLASDRQLLRSHIAFRLGRESLQTVPHNTNTKKCESINRGISASPPKNVNFGRNAEARAHAAIHCINCGLGKSLLLKLKSLKCPVTKGGSVAKSIKQMQTECEYKRQYIIRKAVRLQQARTRKQKNKRIYESKAFEVGRDI